MSRIQQFNKPYGAICQFSCDGLHPTPADYIALPGFYPADVLIQIARGCSCCGAVWNFKDGLTRPAEVRLIGEPESTWPRDPPIRERKSIPATWPELAIREGRNRQVQRMTAAGYPILHLIRWRIGDWSLDDLAPGQWQEAAK